MKKILVLLAIAFLFSAAVPVWPAAQFGRSKEPEDHTRTLNGHVYNGQDQPIPKAIVYLKNTKTLQVKTYISEADGSYHFPALSPTIDYEVSAEHNGVRSDTKTLSAFDSRKIVNINLRVK